ncbi:MAG: DUF1501 domain-containing protein [Pirellulaceae bacterium]|nr:DUF1501 domain-containing protein [Pirellulaceae bacterium]
MLNVFGTQQSSFCDGLSRRHFLRIGGLGMAGLSLADLLRLKAHGEIRAEARSKSIIMIYLPGGPSHIDMYDMKPDAPVEYRGEFKPIHTNVTGIDICEHMPLQARIADKLAIVRGLKTFAGGGNHDAYELLTSDPRPGEKLPPNPLPAFGSVVSKIRGVDGSGVPPYVGIKDLHLLVPSTADDPETAAYLGDAYRPFRTTGPRLANLSLDDSVSLDRLADRKTLLRSFDSLKRGLDNGKGTLAAVDSYTAQALAMISSNKVRDAFDLSREPDTVRAAYGEATDFLLARRLVEAGVRVVTLPGRFPAKIGDFARGSLNHWDTHSNNFKYLRLMLPKFDQAVTALIFDIYQRGLDKDVTVLIWGEFGRTPQVDNSANFLGGRGHWPEAGFALVSGGGLKMGQVIGETNDRAERAKGRPYTPSNVLATLYHALGIDPSQTFADHSGRPRYILDDREPIRELV